MNLNIDPNNEEIINKLKFEYFSYLQTKLLFTIISLLNSMFNRLINKNALIIY